VAKSPNGFKSVAHRKAVFASDPELGKAIARKHGSKVGGGFSKAQISRRRSAAGQGKRYK
jgi:hypothetical protein